MEWNGSCSCILARTCDNQSTPEVTHKNAFQQDAYRPLIDRMRGKGGRAWQGACMVGGVFGEGACAAGGCAWRGVCMARGMRCRRDGNCSGRNASYWNASLFFFYLRHISRNLWPAQIFRRKLKAVFTILHDHWCSYSATYLARRQVDSIALISLFPDNHLKKKYNSTIAYIEHFRLVDFFESLANVILLRWSTDNFKFMLVITLNWRKFVQWTWAHLAVYSINRHWTTIDKSWLDRLIATYAK